MQTRSRATLVVPGETMAATNSRRGREWATRELQGKPAGTGHGPRAASVGWGEKPSRDPSTRPGRSAPPPSSVDRSSGGRRRTLRRGGGDIEQGDAKPLDKQRMYQRSGRSARWRPRKRGIGSPGNESRQILQASAAPTGSSTPRGKRGASMKARRPRTFFGTSLDNFVSRFCQVTIARGPRAVRLPCGHGYCVLDVQ